MPTPGISLNGLITILVSLFSHLLYLSYIKNVRSWPLALHIGAGFVRRYLDERNWTKPTDVAVYTDVNSSELSDF